MLSREIKRIIKENERYAKIFEEYDKTGKFPLEKIRRSFTLKRRTIKKLKSTSEETGKSMSNIIDSLVEES